MPVSPALQKLIPPEASAYLALKLDWPALFTRTLALLDAIVPDNKMTLSQMLAKEEARRHVKIERDILPFLEPIILIHDAPQHPLRLPLMVTIIGAAQPDHAADVKTSLNTLLGVADKVLDQRSNAHAATGNPEMRSTDAPPHPHGQGRRYVCCSLALSGRRGRGAKTTFHFQLVAGGGPVQRSSSEQHSRLARSLPRLRRSGVRLRLSIGVFVIR